MSWAGGAGRGAGVPGSTCWSSMSCGMAPTIWMAIFTTSLGGGMAPRRPRTAGSSGLCRRRRLPSPRARTPLRGLVPPPQPRAGPAPSPELTRVWQDPPPAAGQGLLPANSPLSREPQPRGGTGCGKVRNSGKFLFIHVRDHSVQI